MYYKSFWGFKELGGQKNLTLVQEKKSPRARGSKSPTIVPNNIRARRVSVLPPIYLII